MPTLCGAKTATSGRCRRPLAGGNCPHHGTPSGTSPAPAPTVAVAASADPFAPSEPAAAPASTAGLVVPNFATSDDLAAWANTHLDDGSGDLWTADPDGYEMVVAFDRPVDDPAHLIAYFTRGELAMGWDGFDGDIPGEPVGFVEANGTARMWRYGIDTTKSRRDDIGIAFEGFAGHMRDGSPVRKTNRSGPGTAGTRAVDGVGQEPTVAFRY